MPSSFAALNTPLGVQEHKGYKLEGMWSRLDYMKNPRGYGAASVNAFHATRALPCLSGGLPGGRGKPGEHGAKDGGKSGIFDPG